MKRLVAAAALFAASCTVQLQEDHFFHPGPVQQQDDTAKWQLPAGYTAVDVMLPMPSGRDLRATAFWSAALPPLSSAPEARSARFQSGGRATALQSEARGKLREQDNIAKLKEFASAKDKVTPVELSKKLLEEAMSRDKELLITPGANHGQALETADALAKYRAFIVKINS